jgi:PEP-CTERM motif
MRNLKSLAIAVTIVAAGPAQAQLSENFDGQNGGATALNYTSFTQFGVIGVPTPVAGAVDLIKSGDYGINCAGGSGSCVDLDGSKDIAGTLVSGLYSFNPGDLITLSFDLSGNQRGVGRLDGFFAGFFFINPYNLTSTNATGGVLSPGPFLNFASANYAGTFGNVTPNAPFSTYTLTARTAIGGQLRALIGQDTRQPGANDNVGPILDNVRLSIAGAVPEPATWAMMLVGFALIGTSMRRKRATGALAAS